MDFDSDDEIIAVVAIAAYFINKKRKRKPRFRIHPYLLERKEKGRFATDVSKYKLYII